jgi:dTDP-4-amino-4,6-dideoxygalactose transaminase
LLAENQHFAMLHHMQPEHASHAGKNFSMSRREFLATSSAALVASAIAPANANSAQSVAGSSKIALLGGEKAVPQSPKLPLRWGEPERVRLNAMLDQDSLFYWKGPQTTLFIDRFKKICPAKFVMPCSSGTAALHIAVAAAGIGPGDEVITSPITDIGTVIGVIYQLGVPVFADLRPSTYNLDPADVEKRITSKTKAIIAVHLCGNPCDMHALKTLSEKHNLVLIEDAAQAWGSKFRGQPIGTIGHFACFSLQNSKQITCGDGGVVASNDERFGPLLQKFGDKGFDRLKGGLFESFATNYRISEPQAAVAAAQLDRLESIIRKRSQLGTLLTEKIAGLPGVLPHQVHPEDRCGYWFYFFRLQPGAFNCPRADFVKALAAEGVEASAGYIPVPLHRNPVFQKHAFFAGRWPVRELGLTTMNYTDHHTPEAEAILESGIRITIHEAMTDDYIKGVAEAIRKVARHYAV